MSGKIRLLRHADESKLSTKQLRFDITHSGTEKKFLFFFEIVNNCTINSR